MHYIRSALTETCTAQGQDGTAVTLSPDQAAAASTIAAVATAKQLPERAVTIALATAMQESKLRDIDYGDRDSLGLFQQRPSQGWGTPAEILDPVHASAAFYTALTKVPRYLQLPLTEAAQKVQHSNYPQAYARHEQDAATLSAALTGREGAALSCRVRDAPAADESASPSPSSTSSMSSSMSSSMTTEVAREFGPGPTWYAASPADVTFQPAGTSEGWALALWLVCHAKGLHIASVDFGGRDWNSTASASGWTGKATAQGDGVTVKLATASS